MKSSSRSGIPSLHFPATHSLQFPEDPSSLRVFPERNETKRNCGSDVEHEDAVEVDDSPVTTRGTKFSTWLTTTGTLESLNVLFAKLAKGQYGRSVLEQLHSDENMKIMHIHLRFFTRLDLQLAVTALGFQISRVSNCSELKSFLLNMCIEAPESITNYRSSG